MSNFQLLIAAALLFAAACYSPKRLAEQGKYDKAVRLYAAQSRTGQLKSDEKLARSEWVFALAQTKDLIELQNFAPDRQPADWIEVHRIWQRIVERQRLVERSFGQVSSWARPGFHFFENADSIEHASRTAAAQFFYEKAMAQLAVARRNNDRRAAREAYADFLEIEKRYFNDWHDVPARLAEARELGTTHFTVQIENFNAPAFFSPKIEGFESDWAVFHTRPTDEVAMDFQIVCSVMGASLGWAECSRNCRTECRRIEVGEKVVKDSTGKVIEREVIYETVTAEICEFTTTRTAIADLLFKIYDLKNGQLVGERFFQEGYSDSESCVSVSGDSRATSCSSTCFSAPFGPSDFWMSQGLERNVQWRLGVELRSLAGNF